MTIHARTIPGADRIIFLQVGRREKGLVDRRPHFFGNDVSKRKLLERAAFAGFEPGDLQRVRTGDENDLLSGAVVTA